MNPNRAFAIEKGLGLTPERVAAIDSGAQEEIREYMIDKSPRTRAKAIGAIIKTGARNAREAEMILRSMMRRYR